MEFNMIDLELMTPFMQKIYTDDQQIIEKQLKRFTHLVDLYKKHFGEGALHFFSTPGRTEIGGNHTDHNNGRVLASSVNIDSIAVAFENDSNYVIIHSEGFDEVFKIDLNDLTIREKEKGRTSALIRGIAAGLKRKGYKTAGFNACITSDVLPGSGLSSSASIEVLIGSIFNGLFNKDHIPAEELAKIGQYAENEFFGKPCGLMDQLACAIGGIISIDFKNPEKPQINKIDFDFAEQKYCLAVVDTGGNHADLTDDYASIPNEMYAVARLLNKENCREISDSELRENISKIRHKIGDRPLLRVMHFIEENERVLKQVSALQDNRFHDFLKLVSKSGDSSFKWLQNVYSINNVNEQGLSVALAITESFIAHNSGGACRIHGGGFAGTIQAFLPEKEIDDYRVLMESVFGSDSVKILQIRHFGTLHLNSLNSN